MGKYSELGSTGKGKTTMTKFVITKIYLDGTRYCSVETFSGCTDIGITFVNIENIKSIKIKRL